MKTYNIGAMCLILGMNKSTFKKKVVKFKMTGDKLKDTRFKYTEDFLKKFKKEQAKRIKA